MWWKLTGLALLEALLIWWLTKPIPTHAVVYDPTRAPVSLPSPTAMQVEAYAAIIAVVLIPLLAFWIYRRAQVE
jgi:hypothetical protein